jgi:hypothetical protein
MLSAAPNFVSAERNQSAGKVPRPDEAVMSRQQDEADFETIADRPCNTTHRGISFLIENPVAAKFVKVRSNKATNKSLTAPALAARPGRFRLVSNVVGYGRKVAADQVCASAKSERVFAIG